MRLRALRVVGLAVPAFMVAAAPIAAQRATLSAGYAIGEYSEQSAAFAFNGSGPTASGALGIGRLSLVGDLARLQFSPTGRDAGALQSFTMTDVDVALRYRVHPLVSLEAGVRRRYIAPTGAAEELGAVHAGARIEVPLAPGATAAAQLGYVGAGEFSGGGSAPFGAAIGLGFAYSPGLRHLSIVGDYRFERIDRRTTGHAAPLAGTTVDVPLGTSVGRLGLAVRL